MNALALVFSSISTLAAWQTPALEFPQVGLDEPDAYEGYATRLFRDARGNALQIYFNAREGRLVHVWADASDASAAFSARDAEGNPARLAWDCPGIEARSDGPVRTVRHRLASKNGAIEIGWFLLGTMRQERDFQYQGWHRRPYASDRFASPELAKLIDSLERLPTEERARHLAMLRAESTSELRTRIEFRPTLRRAAGEWVATLEHESFDGRNRMAIELRGDASDSEAQLSNDALSLRAVGANDLRFEVIVTTDWAPLMPLGRDRILNDAFEAYLARAQRAAGVEPRASAAGSAESNATRTAYRRLERAVTGLELLSSEEKLMAALPNYATYFGRDTMLAALMFEQISAPSLPERVIADVLEKLTPSGEVSHEEAVGEQAIRENALEYVEAIEKWEDAARSDARAAAEHLADARRRLEDLRAVRENYDMIDDDFQLAVLVDRYLARADASPVRKRAFWSEADANGVRRLDALANNLARVARLARPYADRPEASNLVGFSRRDEAGFKPGSWRDSRAGYANGRFAMDVNVAWVPAALDSIGRIRNAFDALDLPLEGALARHAGDSDALARYLADDAALRAAIATWRGAARHFEVRLEREAIERQLAVWLGSLEVEERAFWQRRIDREGDALQPLAFLALALDDTGAPIPVSGTDVATDLFLRDYTGEILRGELEPNALLQRLEVLLRPYPLGLALEGVGPLIANDAFASPAVRERFRDDEYHSPRTVWGREVNLLLLGLARQIAATHDDAGALRGDAHSMQEYVRALRRVLDTTLKSVEDSGMQHNELWSYRIEGGSVHPLRFGISSDVQLWNLTDLAVRFALDELPSP